MEKPASHSSPQRVVTTGGSPVGAAALATVLHLAVLASRIHGRSVHHAPPSVLWNAGSAPAERHGDHDSAPAPSNPHQTYCVGRIALTSGMAVIALAWWLHVMRLGAARGL